MSDDHQLEDRFFHEIRQEAAKRGIDPDLVQKKDVHVDRSGKNIQIKWRDVEVNVPGPSQSAIDAWFTENGKVIAGAVVALAGVAVGIGGAALLKR
jgi:hypothetical protein